MYIIIIYVYFILSRINNTINTTNILKYLQIVQPSIALILFILICAYITNRVKKCRKLAPCQVQTDVEKKTLPLLSQRTLQLSYYTEDYQNDAHRFGLLRFMQSML